MASLTQFFPLSLLIQDLLRRAKLFLSLSLSFQSSFHTRVACLDQLSWGLDCWHLQQKQQMHFRAWLVGQSSSKYNSTWWYHQSRKTQLHFLKETFLQLLLGFFLAHYSQGSSGVKSLLSVQEVMRSNLGSQSLGLFLVQSVTLIDYHCRERLPCYDCKSWW